MIVYMLSIQMAQKSGNFLLLMGLIHHLQLVLMEQSTSVPGIINFTLSAKKLPPHPPRLSPRHPLSVPGPYSTMMYSIQPWENPQVRKTEPSNGNSAQNLKSTRR